MRSFSFSRVSVGLLSIVNGFIGAFLAADLFGATTQQQAVRLDDAHLSHWYYRGIYHRDVGNTQQAIADLRKAVSLNDDLIYLSKALRALQEIERMGNTSTS